MQGKESWGFTRCTSFRHRPGHADMLHLDLWWRGENILVDAGSYSYNDPATKGVFNSTLVHNTVAVNDRSQMKRWQRFAWLEWTKAKLLHFENTASTGYFEGEQYGYREAIHRRCIIHRDELWVIVDDLVPAKDHRAKLRLHWLLGNHTCEWKDGGELSINTGKGILCLSIWSQGNQAQGVLDQGWRSLYYGRKEQVDSLVAETETVLPYRLITLVYPEESIRGVRVGDAGVGAERRNGELEIELNSVGEKGIWKK